MRTRSIHPARIQRLNDRAAGAGGYVLYWMQQSQRAHHNHALEYAIQRANDAGLPLACVFGLTPSYPDANARHYRFLLEGLAETQRSLRERGVRLHVRAGEPAEVALAAAREAALVVCDRGYLRHQRSWRARLAQEAAVEVVQVEADVVVPVEQASIKAEFAARTLRPKLHAALEQHLVDLEPTPLARESPAKLPGGDEVDLGDLDRALSALPIDASVAPVSRYLRGGTSAGREHLERFLAERFAGYDAHRNQPQTDFVSHVAAYLHFGQLSPVEVALAARAAAAPEDDRASFLEELLVRRELGANFVTYTRDYDRYRCLPPWAQETLAKHRDDPRPHLYTAAQLDAAETHDPYWNAAMREMKHTGYLHNYMRMYWGKKILEWCNTPEYAYRVALQLNNRYLMDGRDPSSYANVGWIFGLHDRPWAERPVFGTVRTMTSGGLRRKADPDAYVDKVEARIAALAGDGSVPL